MTEITRAQNLAFVKLWTESVRRIHAYLLALVMDRSDTDDLLQEVAATAWEKFPEYDPSRDFVAWANGIARNKVLASRRRKLLSLELTPEIVDLIEQEVFAESKNMDRQLQHLKDCVARLRFRDRQLLQLRYASESPIESIARKVGRTVAACYKALQRTHDQLFDCVTAKLTREGWL